MAYLTNGLKDIEWVKWVKVTQWCLTLWDTMVCPWNSPNKNTGMDCHSLLKGTFQTQGSNPGLLHCRRFFTVWATREVPKRYLKYTKSWTSVCKSLTMESRDSRVRLVGVDSGFAHYELCDLYQTIQWTYLNSLDLCFHVYKIQVITSTLKDDEKFK